MPAPAGPISATSSEGYTVSETGSSRRLSVGRADGDVDGLDRHVALILATLQPPVFEQLDMRTAALHFLSWDDQRPARHPRAVGERSVQRAQVFNQDPMWRVREARVVPRHHRMIDRVVALGIAADDHRLAREGHRLERRVAHDHATIAQEPRGGNLERPQIDVVAGHQRRFRDAVLDFIDGGAVAGAQIFQEELPVLLADPGVIPRDHRVVQDHVGVGCAADADHRLHGGAPCRPDRWATGKGCRVPV